MIMKTLVAYTSRTGNTEKIARAIFNGIPGYKVMKPMSEIKNIAGFDIIFAGFPVYNFEPDESAKEFMKNIKPGKKTALFMTMALTAAPDNKLKSDLYELTINNCKKCVADTKLLGIFECPGELSEQTANALLKSSDPMLQQFGRMRHFTIGYPNEENIRDAESYAKKLFAAFNDQVS
jgi:flavodoxin I